VPAAPDPLKRLELIKRLTSLPAAQLSQVIFALNPPKENIPGQDASTSDRSTALLEWVESNMGCGLATLETVMGQVMAPASGSEQNTGTTRVFVSYKRDMEPDESVAKHIVEALGQTHAVFFDQTMLVGTPWADKIKSEIKQSDALIVLLSEHSVHSEMVQSEVAMAHDFAHSGQGKPAILPVRLAYREPFQYPLSTYLDPINWAFWSGPQDTTRLIQDLEQALAGSTLPLATPESKAGVIQTTETRKIPRPSPSAQPQRSKPNQAVPLELPEGTMMPDSGYYVERSFRPDCPGDDSAAGGDHHH
jgi:hypothetical protein